MANQRFFSIWLSLSCIIVFILQTFFNKITNLLILNSDKSTEIWRFLTSIFLHASLSHLILNLFALILFGLILEKVIGSKKFLIVYFISGLVANLVAINFYSLSLGASGAIYGILGCLTILRPKMTIWAYNLPMPMFVTSILWILIGIFGLFSPSNTGHIAHLSGIVIGFLIGLYFFKDYQQEKKHEFKVYIPEEHMQKWEEVYLN